MDNFVHIYETLFQKKFSDSGFNSCYGVSPEICEWLWNQVEVKVKKETHLLVTLHFLKCYPTFEVLSATYRISERFCREVVWNTVDALDSCLIVFTS